jgi:hypothetical protein
LQGAVATNLKLLRAEASLLANTFGVGFIDWLYGVLVILLIGNVAGCQEMIHSH